MFKFQDKQFTPQQSVNIQMLPLCPVLMKHGGVNSEADVTVLKVMVCRNASILTGNEYRLGLNEDND
jgi:hypothetical protein